MAASLRSKRRSSKVLRLVALAGLFFVMNHVCGPTFNVHGSWDGALSDVRNLPQGLGPSIVRGHAFEQETENGHIGFDLEGNQLGVNYQEGPMSLRMDPSRAWQLNLTGDDAWLQMQGLGADDVTWRASKQRVVDGLGNVELNLTSNRDVGVSLSPSLPELFGFKLKGLARSHGKGLHGQLEARRQLSKNFDVAYNVENLEGDYDLSKLAHAARLEGRLLDGKMLFDLARQRDASPRYNVSLAHNLGKLGRLFRGSADAMVGADNAGVYGTLAKKLEAGRGLHAAYEFAGRSDHDWEDPTFAHSLQLSHGLGNVKVSHASDQAVKAILESDRTRGLNRIQGKLAYSADESDPEFNVTLSRDLANILDKLDAHGTLRIGADSASPDGVYAELKATRRLGKNTDLQYSSGGRIADVEHSLKLSNDVGYAELVRTGSAAPRVRLGYDFEA